MRNPITIIGLRAQIIYWVLGLSREHEQSEEKQMVMNDSGSEFNEQDTNGKSVRGGVTPRIRLVQLKYVFQQSG